MFIVQGVVGDVRVTPVPVKLLPHVSPTEQEGVVQP